MTPILTREAFAALGAPHLVYVRPIKADEVMKSLDPNVIQTSSKRSSSLPKRRCMRYAERTASDSQC